MVAIGRGAMGNPWIFAEIDANFHHESSWCPPSLREKADIMKKHIEKLCEYKGEKRGLQEARKHIASYIKDIPGAAMFRKSAFAAQNKKELLVLCSRINEIN
jgi:tRNA-dihydrouridine synthase